MQWRHSHVFPRCFKRCFCTVMRSRRDSVAQIAGLPEGGGLTEELPLQMQRAAAEKSEFTSGCFCVVTEGGKKKTALERGVLELEETTFHKRFERHQSKAASGPRSPLPAECNWGSVHGEGTTTCGDRATYLSCA